MNIGIDIDDTISKTYEIICELAKEYNREVLKREVNINNNLEIKNPYWCQEYFSWNDEEMDDFWDRYYLKYINEVDIKENAKEVINDLAKNNNIYIITARYLDKENKAEDITKNWLERNNIKYTKLIMDKIDKTNDVINNNIDIFIDDNYKTCKEISNLGVTTYMMESNINKNVKDEKIIRVNSWNEIKEYIKF